MPIYYNCILLLTDALFSFFWASRDFFFLHNQHSSDFLFLFFFLNTAVLVITTQAHHLGVG